MFFKTNKLDDDDDDDGDDDDVVTAAARDGQPAEVAQRHVQLNSHSVTYSSRSSAVLCSRPALSAA